jgi:hypothetical protein
MTAHVAEAGESRGRVVLQSSSAAPNPAAIEAAIKVARAFQSEIESIFVEDQNLLELASFPFAREISATGRSSRPLSVSDLARDLHHVAIQFHRNIEQLARQSDVPVRRRDMRDEPLKALARACAECGPWNVVAIADPFTSPSFPSVSDFFETIADVTGLVVVGPDARRAKGALIVACEDIDLLPGMLRAADRIAAVDEAQVKVVLICDDERALPLMESQSRLVLGDFPAAMLEPATCLKAAGAVVEVLRRLAPGLIIARFGGLVVPSEAQLRPFASVLECPLLLVR